MLGYQSKGSIGAAAAVGEGRIYGEITELGGGCFKRSVEGSVTADAGDDVCIATLNSTGRSSQVDNAGGPALGQLFNPARRKLKVLSQVNRGISAQRKA